MNVFLQRHKYWLLPIIFFVLALSIRATTLGTFQTADEFNWIERTSHFVNGLLLENYKCPPNETGRPMAETGWGCTLQSSHPGVTTMWLTGAGLVIYYWQNIDEISFEEFLYGIDPTDANLLASLQLPFAVISALFFPIFYLLLRQLVAERVAIFTVLLLILHPWLIAHARVIHHDNLNSIFMTFSLLTMVGYWYHSWQLPWLVISGLMAGLAILSKPIGFVMLPCAAVVGTISLFYHQRWSWLNFLKLIGQGSLFAITVALAFAIFLPAIWVSPDRVFQVILWGNSDLASTGHLQYFLGNVSTDPGLLFYPIVWFLRSSPLEIIGVIFVIGMSWPLLRQKNELNFATYLAFAVFISLTLLVIISSPKKQDRYLLSAYPVITVFAVAGLLWLWDRIYRWRWQNLVLTGLILLIQGWFVVANYPYYLTYYNPLFGSISKAGQLITVGWGEGLDKAADYVNQQPQAQTLQVTVPKNSRPFRPFFVGTTLDASPQGFLQADYIVYYRNFIQRLDGLETYHLNWEFSIKNYDLVYQVELNDFVYAQIYRNPYPLHYLLYPDDNNLPERSNFLGYSLDANGNSLIFWQDLRPKQHLSAGLLQLDNNHIAWVTCDAIAPGEPKSIKVSRCPLAQNQTPPGDYKLLLGLQENTSFNLELVNTEGIGVIAVDQEQRFHWLSSSVALAQLDPELIREVTPLNVDFGGQIRLVGYQLRPNIWQPAQPKEVILYWQLLRPPDFELAKSYRLTFRLTQSGSEGALDTAVHPLVDQQELFQSLQQDDVIAVQYLLTSNTIVVADDYELQICLAGDDARLFKCFALPVKIDYSE